MKRDPWQVETHEQDDPVRPVVLRTTLLPIGDVLLAVDRGWWSRASWGDRQEMLAAHRAAVMAALARRDRVATLGGLAGAAGGAALAWAVEWPLPAVMPGTALLGWAAARLAQVHRLRAGLAGTRR